MKIVRYQDGQGKVRCGALQGDGAVRRIEGDIFGAHEVTSETAQEAKRLAPILPSAILAIGLNYREHARESGAKIPDFPILFFKGVNSLQNPGDPIVIPTHLRSNEVDYEAELAIVIGKACKNASKSNAMDYVYGYTCANDVSARDWQIKFGGSQWCRGKTFDTFCPLGPCIVTKDEIANPNDLRMRCTVSGEVLQDINTSDMIFDVPALIEFLSGSTTLLPGTVILTGTPQGVGMGREPKRWLHAGDTVTVEIEKIGSLTNPVVEE